MSVIGSGDTTFATTLPSAGLVAHASGGGLVAVVAAGGTLVAASSTDGSVWSTLAALPGNPTLSGLSTLAYQTDTDTLWLWYAASGAITSLAYRFDPIGHTFGAAVQQTYLSSVWAQPLFVDAQWTGTEWLLGVLTSGIFGQQGLGIASTPGDGTVTASLLTGYTAAGVQGLSVRGLSPANAILVFAEGGRGQLTVLPIGRAGSTFSYVTGAAERVPTTATPDGLFDLAVDVGGAQVLVLSQAGQLTAFRRTGVQTYSLGTSLGGALAAGTMPRLVRDATSGDVYVVYQTAINQSAGELYAIKRQGGSWQPPTLFVTNGATGAAGVAAEAGFGHGSAAVVYTSGGVAQYAALVESGPPLAPTPVSPQGTETSLVPQLVARYNPVAPADGQGAREYLVTRQSDGALQWDAALTGAVTSAAYDGTALAYGITYLWQCRDKDTLANAGAGAWGPWSAQTPFVPTQGLSVTITQLASDGVALAPSPASLPAPALAAQALVTSPAGHAANAYRQWLYAADGVTVVAQTALVPLDPGLASGSTLTTADWRPAGLANGQQLQYVLEVIDATTGLSSLCAPYLLTASWTGPAAPGSLQLTPEPDSGFVHATWPLPAGAAAVVVQSRRLFRDGGPAEDWHTWVSGVPWTWCDLPLCVDNDYQVQVYAIGGSGIPGTPIQRVTSLAPQYGVFSVWFNLLSDLAGTKVAIGAWDQSDVAKRQRQKAYRETVSLGGKRPKRGFRRQGWWLMTDHNWLIPAWTPDAAGVLHYGDRMRDTLAFLGDTPAPVVYRDPVGMCIASHLTEYTDSPSDEEPGAWRVTVSVREADVDIPVNVIPGGP